MKHMCPWCNVEIEYDAIYWPVRRLKEGKLHSIDKIAVEYLKRGEECVLEWLLRMFNGCIQEGMEECMYCASV